MDMMGRVGKEEREGGRSGTGIGRGGDMMAVCICKWRGHNRCLGQQSTVTKKNGVGSERLERGGGERERVHGGDGEELACTITHTYARKQARTHARTRARARARKAGRCTGRRWRGGDGVALTHASTHAQKQASAVCTRSACDGGA